MRRAASPVVISNKGLEAGGDGGRLLASFPPLEPPSAKLLILGSMPGVASLAANQYYGHPYNRFWPFMDAIFGVPRAAAYEQRVQNLLDRGIAVWDVLKHCERPGSLDASIVRGSEVPNAIPEFLERHPNLRAIALNGRTAETAFRRHLLSRLGPRAAQIETLPMPSTSPANAGRSDADKLAQWSALKRFVFDD